MKEWVSFDSNNIDRTLLETKHIPCTIPIGYEASVPHVVNTQPIVGGRTTNIPVAEFSCFPPPPTLWLTVVPIPWPAQLVGPCFLNQSLSHVTNLSIVVAHSSKSFRTLLYEMISSTRIAAQCQPSISYCSRCSNLLRWSNVRSSFSLSEPYSYIPHIPYPLKTCGFSWSSHRLILMRINTLHFPAYVH